MRFLHLADLHFGKSIYGTNLIDTGDQRYWTEQFLDLAGRLKPDAVVIAGDVYDRGLPSGKAAQLLSFMLTRLADLDIPALLTAGNHDSIQHLSFLSPLLAKQKVFISKPLDQSVELTHMTLQDEHGPVTFWLMPYISPALASQVLGNDEIRDYDTAVRRILREQSIDFTQRNVLVAHQNVTANGQEVERGGSESQVGGIGQVDYTAFDGFDYVALGHIHSSYSVGRETVRYAGSPLAYHFNETRQPAKGPLLVTLPEKDGTPLIERHEIIPLHRMREIKGVYDDIQNEAVAHPWENEYLKIVLTDRRISPEISSFLRDAASAHSSTILELTSEFNSFMGDAVFSGSKDMHEKPVEALFAEFYTARNNGVEPDAQELDLLAFVGDLTRSRVAGREEPKDEDFRKILEYVLGQEGQK